MNERIVLRHRIDAVPQAGDFDLVREAIPDPADGELLIRHICLSLDPYMGSAIKGRHMSGSVQVGDTLPGETIGRVMRSRHADFAEGDLVVCRGGWQTHSVAKGGTPDHATTGQAAALSDRALPLDPAPGVPMSAYLGVLGMPGLTAYAGVSRILVPRPGETFVVSAASGAVGATAGQIARQMGARVIGVAGSADKCRLAEETFGFDHCLDRHSEDWGEALAALCPDGVDAYFDTVGGTVLATVLPRIALRGRITLCGMMEPYNSREILPGPNLAPVLARRATITGLVVYDHWDQMPRWRRLGAEWIANGKLVWRESRSRGLASAPAAFETLMAGCNLGKTIIDLDGEA